MNGRTEVLRDTKGDYNLRARAAPLTLDASDITAGNRYDAHESAFTLIPDPEGPWLALVTHRGENAPPRPATLPIGTRVRRGPDWCYQHRSGDVLGTVVEMACGVARITDGWVRVQWPDYATDARWGMDGAYDLEVVSLPAEKRPSGVADKVVATTTPAFKVGDRVRLRYHVTDAMLGFHDMEHLLEDAEPAGIVPRASR